MEHWNPTEWPGQRAIAGATFDRIEGIGLDLVIHPSAEAERCGWSEAFGSEPVVYSLVSLVGARGLTPLVTVREREVLALMAEGRTNTRISRQLWLRDRTRFDG